MRSKTYMKSLLGDLVATKKLKVYRHPKDSLNPKEFSSFVYRISSGKRLPDVLRGPSPVKKQPLPSTSTPAQSPQQQ